MIKKISYSQYNHIFVDATNKSVGSTVYEIIGDALYFADWRFGFVDDDLTEWSLMFS